MFRVCAQRICVYLRLTKNFSSRKQEIRKAVEERVTAEKRAHRTVMTLIEDHVTVSVLEEAVSVHFLLFFISNCVSLTAGFLGEVYRREFLQRYRDGAVHRQLVRLSCL